MTIMSIRPKSAYGSQGLARIWSKNDRFHFAWPEFAELGEEAIKNKELVLTDDDAYNEGTFGYLPRYSEYKYKPSLITGDIRTDLAYWSLHRTFGVTPGDRPTLDGVFVQCDPSNRIWAIDPAESGTRTMIAHIYNKVSARRPLPFYGTPTL